MLFTRVILPWTPLILLAAATTDELLHQAEEKIQREQFVVAEPLLRGALRQAPDNVQVLYRLGYVQFRQRKLREAIVSFSTAVKTAPPAYHSRYFLGRIAILQNNPRQAIEWLQPVFDSREPVFDTPSQLAAAYARTGQVEKALTALGAAIAEAPWDGALYYRMGQLHSQKGQKEVALEAFANSRRLKNASREDVEILMRASQQFGEGRRKDGLQSGAEIQGRKDPDPNSLVALGVIYGTNNMPEEALGAFDRAASLDPALFQAQYNRGLALLKLQRTPEALSPLARAAELLPQSLEANLTYGLASVMTQRYAEAISPLQRVWKLDPSNTRAGALLATSYLRSGERAKAVSVLQSSSFRSATEPASLLLLVEALNAVEDQEGALAAALEAQKRFPQTAQSQLAVAQQLARLGRYQDAQPAFQAALQLMPGHPEAELGLADTYQKSGDHKTALDHYRPALTNQRTAVAARAGMARSLTALRQLEEGRTLLEEGIALYPGETSLRVELSRVYARLGKPDLAAEQARIVEKLRGDQANKP